MRSKLLSDLVADMLNMLIEIHLKKGWNISNIGNLPLFISQLRFS